MQAREEDAVGGDGQAIDRISLEAHEPIRGGGGEFGLHEITAIGFWDGERWSFRTRVRAGEDVRWTNVTVN